MISFLKVKSTKENWGTASCMSVSSFCGRWPQKELLLASMPNDALITLAWSSMIQLLHCFTDFNVIVLITLEMGLASFVCLFSKFRTNWLLNLSTSNCYTGIMMREKVYSVEARI